MVPTFSDWQIFRTFPVFFPFASILFNKFNKYKESTEQIQFYFKNQRKKKLNKKLAKLPALSSIFIQKFPDISSILDKISWLFQSVQISLTGKCFPIFRFCSFSSPRGNHAK